MTEEQLPDRRKHGYVELEKKLEEHKNEITYQLRGFFVKALVAFAVLGLSCAIALAGFGMVLRKQSDITNEIQQQRFDTLVQSCRETNDRNKDVNAKIDGVISATPDVPPGKRKAVKRAAEPFRLVISAAVPLRENCQQYARGKVQP